MLHRPCISGDDAPCIGMLYKLGCLESDQDTSEDETPHELECPSSVRDASEWRCPMSWDASWVGIPRECLWGEEIINMIHVYVCTNAYTHICLIVIAVHHNMLYYSLVFVWNIICNVVICFHWYIMVRKIIYLLMYMSYMVIFYCFELMFGFILDWVVRWSSTLGILFTKLRLTPYFLDL